MKKLENKVAVIIGASRGIGKGIANVFCKYGARTVMIASSDKIYESSREFNDLGYDTFAVKADIGDSKQVKEAVEKIIKKYGTIDILVNNAAIAKFVPFLESDEKYRDSHIDINIKGVWNVTREVLPHMVNNGYGRIVNLSSVTGLMVADVGETAYAMTKAAIAGFTKSLALEVANMGITVNAICPGTIHTEMVEELAASAGDKDEMLDRMAAYIPMKRLGKPTDIGELAAFLSSDEAAYITGTNIVIDGGSTIPESPF